MSIVVVAAASVAGLFIGLIGIGGVLLVPALTEGAEMPVARAVAVSMFGFLLTGIVGTALYLRRGHANVRDLRVLCVTALLGALLGATTLDYLPASAVRLFVAALALVSGIHALALKAPETGTPCRITAPALACLGLAVGYGSAISGTGGPVMLIPALLVLRMPIVNAIALAQAIQIPIALSATVVNAALGRIDLLQAASVGGFLVAGTVAGAWLSKRVRARALTVTVAVALMAIGLWYGYATLIPAVNHS